MTTSMPVDVTIASLPINARVGRVILWSFCIICFGINISNRYLRYLHEERVTR